MQGPDPPLSVESRDTRAETSPDVGEGMWDSLKIPDFRYVWCGHLASSFAMNMQMVARGWLVYAMTTSPTKLAWVMLSFMIPQVVFSLVGGIFADRYNKKKVVAVAQGLNCVATLMLAVIILADRVTFWDFIWFGFFNGTVLALSMPARTAFIPEVVGERLLFNAMALSTTSMNLARILGPALAGGMIAIIAGGNTTSAFGVGIVYIVIAVLYFVSAGSMLFVKTLGKAGARPRGKALQDISEAWNYVVRSELLLGLIILSIIPFLWGMGVSSLMPAFNQDVLGGGPDDLGLLVGAMGIGAIVGSLWLARMSQMGNKGLALYALAGLWAIAIVLFARSTSLVTAMLTVALVGLCSSIFMSMNRSLIQLAVAPQMRGRVMSIDMMSHGLMPLGIIPISFIAEYQTIEFALIVSAVLLAVSTVLLAVFMPVLARIDKGYEMADTRKT